MFSAWLAETTVVDHLLWGAAIGLSVRAVQWWRHGRRPPAAQRDPESIVSVAGAAVK